MIIEPLKIMFVDIPKTGSSAMKRFLYRSYYSFGITGVSNPHWLQILCPNTVKFGGGRLVSKSPRHEPLVSRFMNLLHLNDYFIFTVIRDPFTRFRSAVLEILVHNSYGIKGHSLDNNANSNNKDYYPDSWIINSNDGKEEVDTNLIDKQLTLFLDKFNIIKNKGGFDNYGLCSIPFHFWPQHYFTDLTTPNPVKIYVIKYEHLADEFPKLKEELSYFAGVDTNDLELEYANPTAEQTFGYFNPDAVNTICEDLPLEALEIFLNNKLPSPDFSKKYSTFNDFLPSFNEKVNKIKEYVYPKIEEQRPLVEKLYEKDYMIFSYEQQMLNMTIS